MKRIPRRTTVLAVALYVTIVGALGLRYLSQATAAGGGPLMPVDDAYIHFQYARQAAGGHPFVYNLTDGPTSGATSLLYPFVLGAGYALGFTGLNLGYWTYLIGAVALIASALVIRAISRAAPLPEWLSIMLGAALASWGALVWHAFSGMETALVVLFTLLTLQTYERRALRSFVASASVLAVLRPEAGIMAGLAAVLYTLREVYILRLGGFLGGSLVEESLTPADPVNSVARRAASLHRNPSAALRARRLSLAVPLLFPLLAAAAQPLLNAALTGIANASGSQAKSLLSVVPFDLTYVAERILQNLARGWEGFLFGIDNAGIWILPPLLGIVALLGLVRLGRRRPLTALLPALWLVLIFGLIATLDTANWHFKRYQMPLLALAFPLTAHAAAGLAAFPRSRARVVAYTLILSVFLNTIYIDAHRDNVESVSAQPLAMARYIAGNTPSEALIAVHDVGLIRYLGGRETLDMVGLTTPGMADSWRHGPGAVGEALVGAPRRPDYIAAYTDARGLSYLADSLYGEPLVGFEHQFDSLTNVALGGAFQGIYRPTWEGASAAEEPRVEAVRASLDGFSQIDGLNVAELASEREHDYQWGNTSRFDGFATEMYLFDVPGCPSACRVLDGGRRLNGFEAFQMAAQPNADHILVSRFHAPDGGQIRVIINGDYSVERTLPAIPGQFIEIPTLIPGYVINSDTVSIRVEPVTRGALIFPYRHWLFAGDYPEWSSPDYPAYFQDGAISMMASSREEGELLQVEVRWNTDGSATGDYIAFVHLYDELNAPPVVQSDMRPGDGALPPGAWLPGTLTDNIVLDLSTLEPGRYTLAIGLYDPQTFERVDAREFGQYDVIDNRVLIHGLTISSNE